MQFDILSLHYTLFRKKTVNLLLSEGFFVYCRIWVCFAQLKNNNLSAKIGYNMFSGLFSTEYEIFERLSAPKILVSFVRKKL